MKSKSTRNSLILAGLAVAGLVVSLVILSIHRQIAASGGEYASFCNVNETVNCDVVLSSSYAYLFGVPVGLWGAGAYVLLGLIGVGVARVSLFSSRLRLAQTALALTGWNALFSIYLAAVSIFRINAVCVMCTSLYVINALAVAVAWMVYTGVRSERSRGTSATQLLRRNRAVLGIAAAAALLLVALAVWEGVGQGGASGDVQEIARTHPDFYRWYTTQPVQEVSTDDGNSRGAVSAPVTIVEFSDFQCGHCAKAYRVLKQVLPRYTGQVRMVFRHFPLDSACNAALTTRLHRNSCTAAIAAECAGEQGRFWEFHDRLFENQSRLNDDDLLGYARETGLDMKAFRDCLASDRARQKVERDASEGAKLGIESTPTFFLNGRTIRGSLDPQFFQYAITIARAEEEERHS